MRCKVLFLSFDGLTDPLGQSQILPYLKGISTQYPVQILSLEKPQRKNEREAVLQSIKQDPVQWRGLTYLSHIPFLSQFLNFFRLRQKAFSLYKMHRFTLVHCRSYLSCIIGLQLKRKYGCKVIFDIRGFWVDERVEGKIWSLDNPLFRFIYRYLKRLEPALYERADHIISLTEDGKSAIIQGDLFAHHHLGQAMRHPSINSDKITVIPCCVDFNHFDISRITESQKKEVRDELSIKGPAVVWTYIGSLGTWYMVKEMMQFFVGIKVKEPNAVLVIYTADDPGIIFEYCKAFHLSESAVRVKALSRGQVPVYLSISDYSVFFIQPVFSKRASSPTKMGEIMSLGIPVVCNDIGDIKKLLPSTDLGLILDPSQPFAGQSFSAFQSNPELIIGQAKSYFSLEKGVSDYLKVYESLLKA